MDSILTSIKKLLGISEDYNHFDPDIIMHINSVFMTLTQLGVGPSEGFIIEDEISVWSDFIGGTVVSLEAIKSYTYLKVKLLFDPPLSSAVIESTNRMISELEWRINHMVESGGLVNGPAKLDYAKLDNLPSINGKPLIGNFEEEDPTITAMSDSELEVLWIAQFGSVD